MLNTSQSRERGSILAQEYLVGMIQLFATLVALINPAVADEQSSPLPDRWQLELVPEILPSIPGVLWKKCWVCSELRHGGDGWVKWVTFVPPGDTKNGEAHIVLSETPSGWRSPSDRKVTGYTAPVAIHGPLLEFNRSLHTIAAFKQEGAETAEAEQLCWNCAVQTRPNLWYQAIGVADSDGTIIVDEILAEFATEPQTEEEGKVKVMRVVHWSTEPKTKRINFSGHFTCTTKGSSRNVDIRSDDGTRSLEMVLFVKSKHEYSGNFDTSVHLLTYEPKELASEAEATSPGGYGVEYGGGGTMWKIPQPESFRPSPSLVEFPKVNP